MQIAINEARLRKELETLAGFTSGEQTNEGTAVTRVVFTEDDLHARAWLKQRAIEAGLTVREDAVGNTFFRWEGTEPERAAIGTGSHIDAIPHAGMYDGTVGVLGGLEAIRSLQESGFRPRRSIELLLFTSEEPTRFGIGCLGSRLLAGVLDPERADSMADAQGRPLAEIRQAAGFHGPLSSVKLPQGFYYAWLELHIEQGPLLERETIDIGLVEKIAAPAGYRFTITGLGGHAGALLMPDRRDALCAAAELILSIEGHTLSTNTAWETVDAVATVGTCNVFPGAVNSVPSRVILELDIRDTDPERRERTMQAVRQDIQEICKRRGVGIAEEQINADTPATCSAHVLQVLEEVCAEHGISARKMVSRAYHDSLFMASIAPIAMIFIPCRDGISHRPDEYAAPADIARGSLVLASALARLAMEEKEENDGN